MMQNMSAFVAAASDQDDRRGIKRKLKRSIVPSIQGEDIKTKAMKRRSEKEIKVQCSVVLGFRLCNGCVPTRVATYSSSSFAPSHLPFWSVGAGRERSFSKESRREPDQTKRGRNVCPGIQCP